jgi:multidrug efflux pump subunit AcrA (membrane-fusion protein)
MKVLPRAKAAVVAAATASICAAGFFNAGCSRDGDANAPQDPDTVSNAPVTTTVELSGDQLNSIKIGTVGTHTFLIRKSGIGTIDFENNLYSDPGLSVQVPPPCAGKIKGVFVELGDEVKKDQPLYSVESSDTNQSLLTVKSPLAGQVTSVNATPGLPVDPSNPPAPCSVADVSRKWLLANVPEADSTLFQIGQKVEASVAAFPGKVFYGKITKVYPTVDLSTHRLTIRADISDPANALRAGMLADFTADVQKPVTSVALPANGVVREGDGTMTAWVTTDRQHFSQQIIKIGLREDGELQILDGLKEGELAVTDGAIFLDNMLQAPPSD